MANYATQVCASTLRNLFTFIPSEIVSKSAAETKLALKDIQNNRGKTLDVKNINLSV